MTLEVGTSAVRRFVGQTSVILAQLSDVVRLDIILTALIMLGRFITGIPRCTTSALDQARNQAAAVGIGKASMEIFLDQELQASGAVCTHACICTCMHACMQYIAAKDQENFA